MVIHETRSEPKICPRYSRYGQDYWSVTQVLSMSGVAPDLSHIPKSTLEAKGDIGTALHEYIAAKILDKPRVMKRVKTSSHILDPHIEQVDDFFDNYISDIDPIGVEETVYITDDIYGVIAAGTYDFFGLITIGGRSIYVLIDWKCRMAQRHDRFQTAGYGWGIEQKHEIAQYHNYERWIISFTDKHHKITHHDDPLGRDRDTFRSACIVANEIAAQRRLI